MRLVTVERVLLVVNSDIVLDSSMQKEPVFDYTTVVSRSRSYKNGQLSPIKPIMSSFSRTS